jgi:hypothetical protein
MLGGSDCGTRPGSAPSSRTRMVSESIGLVQTTGSQIVVERPKPRRIVDVLLFIHPRGIQEKVVVVPGGPDAPPSMYLSLLRTDPRRSSIHESAHVNSQLIVSTD